MPVFSYNARSKTGDAINGSMEAESAERVAEQLLHTGMTPIDIKRLNAESAAAGANLRGGLFQQKVELDELIMFCRQMRTLLKAGIPILKGLTGLADSIENKTLAAALRDIHAQLESGRELNVALSQHPKIFMPLFSALVRVGESTGELDKSFEILATYLNNEKDTRRKIKSALRYPMIVIGAVVVAMVIINIWVVPVFTGVFARFGADLPIMTQILMATSSFMVNWWPWMLGGTFGGIIALKLWLDTKAGRYAWDKYLLRVPLIGEILKKATLGRFAQSLSLIVKAGVPMVQGLGIVSAVVNNAYVAEKVIGMREGIEKGDSISRTAMATGLFTSLVLQMISVGEETGEIDTLLMETAVHYDAEVSYALENLSSAIEPIVISILGVMVTVLALGVFLPMWNLAGVAQ